MTGETGRVVGIDLVPAMLGRAEVAVRDRGLSNVELRLGDAEQLEFEPGRVAPRWSRWT